MDTFEYKPQLQKDDGKAGPGGGTLTASKFKFPQHGQTGTWVSELLPAHGQARRQALLAPRPAHRHAGPPAGGHAAPHRQRQRRAHPAVAWARGCCTAWAPRTRTCPATSRSTRRRTSAARSTTAARSCPAHFQGTRINDPGYLPNLKAADRRRPAAAAARPDPGDEPRPGRDARRARTQLDGVIESYELAFRMQGKVPELLDISKEPQTVLDAYGVKPGPAGSFARQCLMARRLSEAGVRFVEICQPGWDHHNNLHKGLIDRCAPIDQPTAALLADLEQRGLLDETLVLFGSEFGRHADRAGARRPRPQHHRLPDVAGRRRREDRASPTAATDEYGMHAVEGRMHTNDLHATLLALMGLDHEQLTYRYAGRDFRLTDVAGKVVHGHLRLSKGKERGTFMLMRRLFLLGLGLFVVSFSSCSKDRIPTVPVSGKVLWENRPLAHATVVLHPTADQGPNAFKPRAVTKEDGTFSLTTYDGNDGCRRGSIR